MKLACIGLVLLIVLGGCRQGTSEANGEADNNPPAEGEASESSSWMQDTWSDAVSSGSQTVEDTTDWITRLYTSARDQGLTTATNVKDWVTDDLHAMGDWEYRILVVEANDPAAVEQQLNEMGTQRWECFHVLESGSGWTLFLKRSRRSMLARIPLRDLANILPALSGDEPAQ